MLFLPGNAQRPAAENAVRFASEAITGLALKGTFERMARRRFQKPKPFLEGNWWWIRIWQDQFTNGRLTRKLKRIKLAPAETKYRDVQREAEAKLQPITMDWRRLDQPLTFEPT
jgi:hypothetical protein